MTEENPENCKCTKILIVDDVEVNRAVLKEVFKLQYTVYEAENGRQALDILEEQHGDMAAVLLDIVMPVLDGYGVLIEMGGRGWSRRIPVIMITSQTSDSVMDRGYELGAVDIISKPFHPGLVRRRVNNIIEQYAYRLHLENMVERQTRTLRENSRQIIDTLSSVIEFKSAESGSHISNIRSLTRLLLSEFAREHHEYQITDELVDMVSQAAAMHDIGKVSIPDRILKKPGRLTPEEYEVMKTHAERGCEILNKLSQLHNICYFDYCYEICRHHHERWDGRGYPDGLVGNETPIWAQVVSLADVYDALTSKRVYKDAYSHETAVQMILNGECGAFNPELLKCFVSIAPALKASREAADGQALPDAGSSISPAAHSAAEQDISDRTLRLLEMERQKYRILSELSSEILFEYDRRIDQLTFSDKYHELTGKDLSIGNYLQSGALNETIYPEDWQRLKRIMQGITPADPIRYLEMQINLGNSGFEWYEIFIYPVWDAEQEDVCAGYIGKLINIDEQIRQNLRLKKAADSDPLTGLLNRNALQEQSIAALHEAPQKQAALCFIDIDNFKSINDIYGHVFGDTVLKRVAAILKSCVHKSDLVGRIGGDEFAVFFRNMGGSEDFHARAEQVCNRLRQNFNGCRISSSIGVACYPQDAPDFKSLLYHADQALYLSKRTGKNTCRFYDRDCNAMPFRSLLSTPDSGENPAEKTAGEK